MCLGFNSTSASKSNWVIQFGVQFLKKNSDSSLEFENQTWFDLGFTSYEKPNWWFVPAKLGTHQCLFVLSFDPVIKPVMNK
jgi:hypothetical protein